MAGRLVTGIRKPIPKEAEEIKKGTETLIKDYHKRWRIKEAGDKFYDNPDKDAGVEDRDRKIGETWKRSSDNKWVTKIAEDTYVVLRRTPEQQEQFRKTIAIKDTCPKCGRKMESKNELKIFRVEGLCLNCLTELDFTQPKKEVPETVSEKDIIIKDHTNAPIMTLEEFRGMYGDEAADRIRREGGLALRTDVDEDERYYTPNILNQLAQEAHANAKQDPKPEF